MRSRYLIKTHRLGVRWHRWHTATMWGIDRQDGSLWLDLGRYSLEVTWR